MYLLYKVVCTMHLGPLEMWWSNVVTGSELTNIVEEESEFWGINCDNTEINLCGNENGYISDDGYIESVFESVCVRNAS